MPILVPIAASPPQKELLMLEQRRSQAAKPRAALGMDDCVPRRDLEVPADDEVAHQRQVKLAGPGLAQRLHLGCESKGYQRHIRRIRHIDLIDALLVISGDIQVTVPHTASAAPFRIAAVRVPLPYRHQLCVRERPFPFRHGIVGFGDLHPQHLCVPGGIGLVGEAVPVPVLPVQELPVLRVAAQKQEGLRLDGMVFQHRVGGIVQLLIQPDGKDGDTGFAYPHAGIRKGDGVQQVIFKIHLRRLEQHHLLRFPQVPDVQLLDLEEGAGVPHKAPVGVLPALGAGQRYKVILKYVQKILNKNVQML